jgi:hypothetical protein
MKQFLFWLEIALFALACLFFFAGERFDLPPLLFLGVISLGGLGLVVGVEVIVKREASFNIRRANHVIGSENYSGCAAQLWGFMFVLFGLGLVLGALAGLFQPQQALAIVDQAFATPLGWGILSTVLGIFTATYGLTRLLAGGAIAARNLLGHARDMGYRLFGILCILIGGGLVVLGLTLIFSPEKLTTFLRQWIPLFS